MSTFQERLRYYREKAGYKTARKFSEEIEIPYSTYLSYENAGKEPKYETLIKIAHEINNVGVYKSQNEKSKDLKGIMKIFHRKRRIKEHD